MSEKRWGEHRGSSFLVRGGTGMLGVTISVPPGMCDWRVEVLNLNMASAENAQCKAAATVTIPVSPHIVANVDKLVHVRVEFVTHDDVKADQMGATGPTPELRRDGGEPSVEETTSEAAGSVEGAGEPERTRGA